MEVMLIQMSSSIPGVLRGDGLKWKPFNKTNIMQALCQIRCLEKPAFARYGVCETRHPDTGDLPEWQGRRSRRRG